MKCPYFVNIEALLYVLVHTNSIYIVYDFVWQLFSVAFYYGLTVDQLRKTE